MLVARYLMSSAIFETKSRISVCILYIYTLFINLVYGQRILNCVIPSLCNDGVFIDPRILTPTSTTAPTSPTTVSPERCPNGYISCLDTKCGVSTVQPGAQDGLATKEAFPWHAFLQNIDRMNTKNGYAGGGVLIDQYFVLTAAHKVTNVTNLNVIMGVYNSSNLANTQTSRVSEIYIHGNYNNTVLKNDVALLLLESPINFGNNINQVCLPAAGKSYQSTSTGCVVSGFGQTDFTIDDAPTVIMKQVHVPIVDTNTCKTSFSNASLLGSKVDLYLDTQNEICAGGQASRDSCTQDGGSPLVCYDSAAKVSNVVGLVIWGKNCGQANVYGVYVNVPSYISWIECTQSCILGLTSCGSCPARKK